MYAALIPSMLYTDGPAPCSSGSPMTTLQIFSVKVVGIKQSLHWPLDVYGIVAARDCLDHTRNIIFSRARDNCQTITKEVCISSLTKSLTTNNLVTLYSTSMHTILSGLRLTSVHSLLLPFIKMKHNKFWVSWKFYDTVASTIVKITTNL